jgi:tRNA (mo5U34)-methyltransferase
MHPEEIRARLADLGWWYHNIDLGHGIWTNPNDPMAYNPETRWDLIERYIPHNLAGKTVLDLGCNSGYFSLMMKKRGADRVLGIDMRDHWIKQATFLAEVYKLDVDFRVDDVYHFCLTNRELFDYVLFLGLFYHLRHPLLVLDHVAAITRGFLYLVSVVRGYVGGGELHIQNNYSRHEQDVFKHEAFPKMFFIEKCYNNDSSNWWFPNEPGLLAVLRSAGFEVADRPAEDTFVCKPVRKVDMMSICDHVSFPVVTKLEKGTPPSRT